MTMSTILLVTLVVLGGGVDRRGPAALVAAGLRPPGRRRQAIGGRGAARLGRGIHGGADQ